MLLGKDGDGRQAVGSRPVQRPPDRPWIIDREVETPPVGAIVGDAGPQGAVDGREFEPGGSPRQRPEFRLVQRWIVERRVGLSLVVGRGRLLARGVGGFRLLLAAAAVAALEALDATSRVNDLHLTGEERMTGR